MNIRLLFLFTLVSFFAGAQQQITLQDQQTIILGNALVYDNGGPNASVVNTAFTATIKSATPYMRINFNYIELPDGASLRIFKGLDTTELISLYDGYYKPATIIEKVVTIKYVPSPVVQSRRGFEARVEAFDPLTMEKVTMPESDCINAIPLCGNSTVNTSANQYDNTGNVNDDNGSCYSGTGNGGSVWYSFSPQSNGTLDFMINPTGSTDYDFVLWDITNGCANKTQMSCNFSATQGATGLNSSGTTDSQDASGTTNNMLENVVTTGVYALCINYYSGNNDGFTLTFHNIASTVNIIDNTPPTIINAYTTNCASASQFTINFSEYIDCNTLQSSDFVLPGYTVNLVTTNCVGGKTLSVVVSVSPSLPPGNYTMNVSNMNDMCGNPLNQNYAINTLTVPVANAGPDQVACSTPGFFGATNYGTVTLTGSGGTAYTWSTGQTGATISVTPSATTTYTLTAIQGSCAATDQVVVTVSPSPQPNLGPDQTICSGFPITLTATGGGTYQWQSTTSTFFGSPTSWTNIAGATSATFTASPTGTIYYRVIVTGPNGCQGSDWIKVTIGSGTFGITAPPFVCQGSPLTLTLPASMTQYTWNVGGTPIGTANTALTVSPTTTTTYTAVSTTPGCTGSANVTVPVHSSISLTATANPTTACAGVPVDLTSTGPTSGTTTVTENFEGATQGFTLVNGTYNRWYHGTAAACGGTKGLYVGTAVGNNNYTISSGFGGLTSNAATNHAYRDYTISSYCNANLSFSWRNNGNANAALRVWLIPTSVTPVAGTALTASATQILLGGPYFDGLTCSSVNFDLTPYAGQTVRIVFSWVNTGGLLAPAVENTAIMIDDVVYTESTTYNYTWTANVGGFSASSASATDTPLGATTYNLTVTRCDGCAYSASVSVTDCTPLPVELMNFTGESQGEENVLYWSTQSEINSDYYIIERSLDGISWEKVGMTPAAGNSTEMLNYTLTDVYFEKGKSTVYRLGSMDLDGSLNWHDDLVLISRETQRKNMSKRYNVLGQEIPDDQKGFILIMYEDGSIEKRYE